MNVAAPSSLASEARISTVAGAAYLMAAAAVAVVHAAAPIPHGWWLVSYLALVGGLSQALLGTGLAALASSTEAARATETEAWVRLALWNLGVVTVALADVAAAPVGVLAGSVLLLAALTRFAQRCLRIDAGRRRRSVGPLAGVYVALIAFLAASVVVGTALAGALPGQ
jgi:hypothetical protein